MAATSTDPADSYQKSDVVQITGSANGYPANGYTATKSFTAIVKNPCVDPSKNWVVAPDGF